MQLNKSTESIDLRRRQLITVDCRSCQVYQAIQLARVAPRGASGSAFLQAAVCSSPLTTLLSSTTLLQHAFGRRNCLASPPGVCGEGVVVGRRSPLRQNPTSRDLRGGRQLLLDLYRGTAPVTATGNYQGSPRGMLQFCLFVDIYASAAQPPWSSCRPYRP